VIALDALVVYALTAERDSGASIASVDERYSSMAAEPGPHFG